MPLRQWLTAARSSGTLASRWSRCILEQAVDATAVVCAFWADTSEQEAGDPTQKNVEQPTLLRKPRGTLLPNDCSAEDGTRKTCHG